MTQQPLFAEGQDARPSVAEELERLPARRLLERVVALGMETPESLRRAWQEDTYTEEGQRFHYHESPAELVAAQRELYVDVAQRVERGDYADYAAAYEAVVAERRSALRAAIEETRGRLGRSVRKPR